MFPPGQSLSSWGVEALLDSAEPEADLVINLCSRPCPIAGQCTGSQGGTLSLLFLELQMAGKQV